MDFMEFMMKASQLGKEARNKEIVSRPPVASLSDEEADKMNDIIARKDALRKSAERSLARIDHERKQWWLDVEKKYSLMDKNLHFDAATKSLYEIPD